MNWTGGSLGRTRNTNASLTVLQQRKYFAKARGRFQSHGTSSQLRSRSEFPLRTQSIDHPQPELLIDDAHHVQRPSQRKLEEFKATEPIVRKLKSINSRSHSLKRKRTPNYDDSDNHSQQSPINLAPSHISISSRSLSSTNSPKASRQRTRSPRPCHQDPTSDPASINIEAQRLRLLATSDWVGIRPTKPTKIDFTPIEDRDQIGKRRRLSQVPHRCKQDYDTVPARRASYFEKFVRSPRRSQATFSQADVSVRIGSEVDRSLMGESDRRASSSRCQSLMSGDEMLLDDEALKMSYGSPRSGYQDSSSRMRAAFPKLRPSAITSTFHSFSSPLDEDRGNATGMDIDLHLPAPVAIRGKSFPFLAEISSSLDEGARSIRSFSESAPPNIEEYSQGSNGSSIGSELQLRGDHDEKQSLQPDGFAFDTCSPNNIASDDLAMLRGFSQDAHIAHTTKQDMTMKLAASYPASQEVEESSTATAEESASAESCQLFAASDERFPPHQTKDNVGKEEATGRIFIDPERKKNQEQSTYNTELETPRRTIAHPQHHAHAQPFVAVGQDSGDFASLQTPKKSTTSSLLQESERIEPLEDEELTWRKFVLGDGNGDNGGESQDPHDENRQADTLRTQSSMVAEIATSPIMPPPHLAEEASENEHSSLAGGDKVSMLVEVDTSSIQQDKMLDGILAELSSETHLPARDEVSYGPKTDESHQSPRVQPRPSSTQNQASTPSMETRSRHSNDPFPACSSQPPAPSSETDPLAWSPNRISHPEIQTLQQHQQNRRQAAVVFKRPVRYVSRRSSDAIEPLVLGRGRSPRRFAGVYEHGLNSEETRGLGWGDDIEDD